MHKLKTALPLAVLAICFDCAKPPRPPIPSVPQALDPLTPTEQTQAEKIARADARVAALIGDSGQLAHIVWFALKPAELQAMPERHAELLFAIASGEYGVRALVRLGGQPGVVEAMRIDARSVPVLQREVDEAWRIAREDPGVREKLGNRLAQIRPEALRTYSEDANDPCSRGRCYYILLRTGDSYLDAGVTVELNSRRVLADRSKLP